MKEMFRDVIQTAMEVELGRERCQRAEASETAPNYRNGFSRKTAKTQLGEEEIKVPRDRNGSYKPKIIGKYSRNADVMMNAIRYKVKEDRRYVTKAVCVVPGITMDGTKDILGVWIGEHESSRFWRNVLNGLKSRGVLDVYLLCTDGLCGMVQAIRAVYPQGRLQRCIIHQIRASTRFASWKDNKKAVAGLKKIYTAVTLEEAEDTLLQFGEIWRKQYPSCVKSWEEDREVLSVFYKYPPEIRKTIYTANMIEGLNRQFRQITKNKPSFTSDDSLRRMLYLAAQRITKRWRTRYQNRDLGLSQSCPLTGPQARISRRSGQRAGKGFSLPLCTVSSAPPVGFVESRLMLMGRCPAIAQK